MPAPRFSIAQSASNRVIFFWSSRARAVDGVFQQHPSFAQFSGGSFISRSFVPQRFDRI
jgi:hypothetical protein